MCKNCSELRYLLARDGSFGVVTKIYQTSSMRPVKVNAHMYMTTIVLACVDCGELVTGEEFYEESRLVNPPELCLTDRPEFDIVCNHTEFPLCMFR